MSAHRVYTIVSNSVVSVIHDSNNVESALIIA